MVFTMSIFDEINLNINPYKELRITPESSDETIKEAYKLIHNSISPEEKEKVDMAYNLIKTPELRLRFKLLRNRPLDSLEEIKKYGFKPKILSTMEWISILKD